MLDLLAAISSVDPPALLAWLVLAFAAGMYPVGIMLGSTCSPCCGQKCSGPCSNDAGCPPGCQCVGGQCGGALPCVGCENTELPDTVTVSVSGWPADRVQGGPLAYLNFESSFGFGASGRVTAPGGDTPGPVSAVELSSGGEGYARIFRSQPVVTASAGGTQVFNVSVEQVGEGPEAYWTVTALSLIGGGTTTGNTVTFSVGVGQFELSAAEAHLVRAEGGAIEAVVIDHGGAYYAGGVEQAAITVTVNQRGIAGASGAVIAAAVDLTPSSPTFGQIVSLSIANGGTGYLAWKWVEICCAPYWNEKTVVLKRPARSGLSGPLNPCLYRHSFINKGCSAVVEVEYSQSSVRVMVYDFAGYTPIGDIGQGSAPANCFAEAFATPQSGESCVEFPFNVTTAQGITFSVSGGGDYVPRDPGTTVTATHVCCRNGGAAPAEIEARLYFPEDYEFKEGWGVEDPEAAFATLMLSRGLLGGPSGAVNGCTISYGIVAFDEVYAGVTRCDDYLLPNCQSCARKCQTRAGMTGGNYFQFPVNHWFSRGCQNCSSDTVCKPSAGVYLINMRDPRFPYADPQPGPETSFFRVEIM